ncbi:hypothetical protein Mapa_014797 [Marchantia paleacea]|nr:hypothetical protein Mapa_014797 [Marchantia paleacea]
MTTTTRAASIRTTFLSSTVKENRPAWYGGCSPGRPNTLSRTGGTKPLGEHKSTGNLKTPSDGAAPKSEKPVVKKNPSPLKSAGATAAKVLKQASPRLRPASPRVTASTIITEDLKSVAPLVTSRPKVTKAPAKNETPPPTRPRKPVSSLVTPTNKGRKPLATLGTPTNQGIKDRSPCLDETPTRKLKERPNLSGGAAAQDGSKARDKSQPFSAWAYSASKTRRGSTPGRGSTPNRAPVKSMFLSPQASKKNAIKKEPLRKSSESAHHGIWIGQVPSRKRGVEKREADGEMPPPAQPTNSPEIPKRGSRELSGEGRGYFGAGPMVAPEGCGGFVRDRRKCKPRGTLVVGNEGLSMDSDSSGVLETSIQMPLPSVASVEWMDRKDMLGGLSISSATSVPEYYNDENQSQRSSRFSQDLTEEEFGHHVKQPRISVGDKIQRRQSRQTSEGNSTQDLFGDGFYHHLKQARTSAGEGRKQQVRQSGQSADGASHSRSSQDVFSYAFYQQLKYSRNNGGEAFKAVRQSRQSGEGFYQPIVRSSQAFLQQLRQSQFSSKEGMGQLSRMSSQSTHSEGIIRDSLQGRSQDFPASAGYADVTIDWRNGLPDSEASSARQSPEEGKTEEFVAGSISFGSSWVPPAQERRMSGGAKTWYAPDSTWYGFSPITPEFHRASQLPEGGSKLIDALVAGSVRRRIMTDQSVSDGDPDLPNKSLIQSLQGLNVDGSLNKSLQSRSSRGSQEGPSLPFSFSTRRSYANIAELEAEQGPDAMDNYMCQTASPIEPLLNDDLICQGTSPVQADDAMCQTASPLHEDSMIGENASRLNSDDMICQTASPINEVCCPTALSIDGSKWVELENDENRWDEANDSEDGVEYASPVAGDYLSPVKPPSQCASPERSTRTMDCNDSNRGVRASRRTSMSRTLEELMRHNLHL